MCRQTDNLMVSRCGIYENDEVNEVEEEKKMIRAGVCNKKKKTVRSKDSSGDTKNGFHNNNFIH